jgi:hypothetical protein
MASNTFGLFKSTFGQSVWRALPVINFGIATVALTFQTTVLYPWHVKLEDDFTELKKVHEDQLSRYHQMKLERLDSIDHKLEALSIPTKPNPSSSAQ